MKNLIVTGILVLAAISAVNAELIGHWKLDQQDVPVAGQTPDVLGLHHGSYIIGAAGGFGAGQIGNAFYMEGDYGSAVSIADDGGLTLGAGDFTAAFWVRFTSDNTVNKLHPLFNKYTSNQFNAQPGFVIYAVDHPEMQPTTRHLEMYSAAGGWDFQGFYEFNTNQWYHLAFVRSGATLTSYVDGVQLMAFGIGAINLADGGVPVILGNSPGPHWTPLNGGMDDVRIYTEALDQTAISVIMSSVCVGPFLRSDINEDCSVNIADLSLLASDWLLTGNDPGPAVFGDNGGLVVMTPGGYVPPLMVTRTVLGGAPHGQAVAVFTNTVDREDVSIKMESTQEFASSNLWFANTFHDVSASVSMGVNPGTPAEMSIVFNEDSSTIPSSVPHPRYTVAADAVIVSQRAEGFSIGSQTSPKSPEATLDVQGNAILSVPDAGLILTAPNGTRYKVTISNSGQLTVTQL